MEIRLKPQTCKSLKIFAPFDTTVELPFVLGAEDKLAFRLDQFNLGAPVKWYRELTNMSGVTKENLKKLSNSTLNENVLPEELEDACYNLALYDMLSLNPEDQKEQKSLYKRMFEHTKSYDNGRKDVLRIAELPAFKNLDFTHKALQFLQDVHRTVEANSGDWRYRRNRINMEDLRRIARGRMFPRKKGLEFKRNRS